MCITCRRGPPYTKKYAKNQCQTCYKKNKKRLDERQHNYNSHNGGVEDFYSMSQNTFNPHMRSHNSNYMPHHYN